MRKIAFLNHHKTAVMLYKAKKKLAYFHGFLHAFFNMRVTLSALNYCEDLKKEFLRGYFETI